jgi:hypothetical protein
MRTFWSDTLQYWRASLWRFLFEDRTGSVYEETEKATHNFRLV